MSRYLQKRGQGQGESEGVTGREIGGKGLEGGRRRRRRRRRMVVSYLLALRVRFLE
jgi:hypothetical protein